MGKQSEKIALFRSSTGVNGWISWGVLAAPGNLVGVVHFLVDLTFFHVMSKCPFIVAADCIKYFRARAAVNSGMEVQWPFSIASIKVVSTGYPRAACRN